ncbi:NADP-dependent oxidoreductase [Pseudonocardia sp. HH130630-07]|uniref:NADP-dependent oxidoreductase n=1 Tax=Pseudonocardia sp. HH130630-07 TaxID=1690815 RepID=UPI000814FAE8|nr:NADP-dependent oxidoreductase [Pseudonocardia sp. HH130630-07]ANY06541.1 NADPH:quinone reductase [Pseudonocardia sp. HH130630-07]
MSTRNGRAVRFDRHGDVGELYVTDVGYDDPAPGRVLVEVRAAGINPGEAALRAGAFADSWPLEFPSGQGSDWSGVVVAVGDGVTAVEPGEDVFGWTDERAAQATHVDVPAEQVLHRPAGLDAVTAGALYTAGAAAAAAVGAVDPEPGETVVVSGAAGGVGQIATQLLTLRGVEVVGVASQRNHRRLREMAVTPVAYGSSPRETAENLRAALPSSVHGWVDLAGDGYVDLAVDLGIRPDRITTIIDFAAAEKHGVRTSGTADAAGREDLAALGDLAADGALEVPIAGTHPLDGVRDAYTELERGHTAGKIVLLPQE